MGSSAEKIFSSDASRYALFIGDDGTVSIITKSERIPKNYILFLDIVNLFRCIAIPLWSLLCVVVCGIIFYHRKIEKPISILLEASENISNNRLDFSVEVPEKNEFGELCLSFEKMRVALKENNIEMWRQVEERKRLNAAFSHDLRTPLTVLKGQSEILSKYVPKMSEEKIIETAETMKRHIIRLETYVNTMNDLQRLEDVEVKKELVDVKELEHQMRITGAAVCKGKEFVLYQNIFDVDSVKIDTSIAMQVYENLLSNAVKFTPAGGTISVRLKQFPGTVKDSGLYEIRVKDNGIGMSAEFVKKIFSPFERERTSTVSRTQGTGLGMAITKNIVDMMGGTIEVQTAQGKGTEFIVRLPFRIQPEQHRIEKIAELEGLKALVVDDDFDTCDSVTKMLVRVGMRSEWTLSGREAVLRVRQSMELGDAFHAYIIDWCLPDMNGIEVTRQIRSLGDDTPIIILTAYDWSDIEAEAKAAGVTAFCAKPLFMSDIRETLMTAIGQSQAGAEDSILPEAGSDFRGRCILLVEDNELNSEIAVEILNEYGFLVDTAKNGAEAVEKVKNSTPGNYDLVLMDVQMPVMNGYEATKEIRALDNPALAGITILAMTANAFDEDRKKALECGMDGFLSKPIVIEELISTLHDNLLG